ncbi:MAG TPA: apolipoprotein N-acyltransferase [Thermoanaerobaculia bacterium]|nr:apolipoprotein N-acyltransferase [Thermoanaerobaculia bacterium]
MSKLIHAAGTLAGLRLLLALAGAAAWVLALPSTGAWALAPLAPAALVLAASGVGFAARLGLGYALGAAAAYGIWGWMFEVPGFALGHSAVLAVYLGAYPAAFAALLPLLGRSRVSFAFGAAALWTALDVLRAHAGFLAFPWGTLGHSQAADLPLLQTAAVFGEEGVTFLVALLGISLAEAAMRRRLRPLAPAAAAVALACGAGALRLAARGPEPALRVAAVQPAILREERATVPGDRATVERLVNLTRAAAAEKPALVVWPETAVRSLLERPDVDARVQALADETGATIVAGASSAEKFPSENADGSAGFRMRQTNLAAVFTPGARAAPGVYRKALLVPFAEYLPAPGFPWPSWLVGRTFDVVPGDGPVVFRLVDGTPFAPLICWENLFSGFVRRAAVDGARVLAQLTNDNWFGATAAPYQHDTVSILRAVEVGVPVVISSNTGPSLVVDGRGRVLASAPRLFAAGTASAAVAPGSGPTPFTKGGWLFGPLACAAAAAAMLDGSRRRGEIPF